MPMIQLFTEAEQQHWVFSDWVKGWKWNAIKRTCLEAVAKYWAQTIFERHFTPGNSTRYEMEQRTGIYENVTKKIEGQGQGKWVDLLLRGKSRMWLRSSARITSAPSRAVLNMNGPSYFANPFIGRTRQEVTTKDGRKRWIEINCRRQPNKPKELTTVNDADRESMRQRFSQEVDLRVKLAVSASSSKKLDITGRTNRRLGAN